jgi:hypothetical protein
MDPGIASLHALVSMGPTRGQPPHLLLQAQPFGGFLLKIKYDGAPWPATDIRAHGF